MSMKETSIFATLPLLVAASGCDGDDEDDVFEISEAAFDDEATITLTFTQPVGDVGEVDPNDFRLSFANASALYPYDDTPPDPDELFTNYSDVGYYEGVKLSFLSVSPGPEDNQLVLEANASFRESACAVYEMVQYQFEATSMSDEIAGEYRVGIFVHYAAGDIPVESAGGVALADIGANWVMNSNIYADVYGYFPDLKTFVRIPCP